jgi:uncharacterized protein YdeI (YjbR/CyaY-like superfamily)
VSTRTEIPILSLRAARQWQAWLSRNHARSDGVWLRFFRKASGTPSVTYAEALDVALCYGWIDSQGKSHDETSYLQKFTPRRARSPWSKINREHVARLQVEGRMQPAGLAEVERAKSDGRWDAAYDSPSAMTVPEDFTRALNRNRTAKRFFETLNRRNTYAIAYRLQSAKRPETREKRIREFIGMLARHEKLYP